MRNRFIVLVLCAGFAVSGCRGRTEPAKPLGVLDPADFGTVVKRYEGKVLLVDYWASWCPPCREMFPHTVELSRRYADRGLAVVSVSLDDADAESEAREFLGEQGATFENLRVASGASPKSVSLLNIENGAIPFLQLYDRTGKLRKTFSGLTNPALIDEAVERLLAEG